MKDTKQPIFEEPRIEVIRLEAPDIIATSGDNGIELPPLNLE